MPDAHPERQPPCDGRLRPLITATSVALVAVPWLLAFLICPQEARRELALCAIPAALVGLFCALGVAEAVFRHARGKIGELRRTIALVEQRERERDSAQQELIRRLQEERELARKKLQFEAQLTEYEKYAALAQLALGAAHEINNPLLGIQSHLELELRGTADAEQREEIAQCIQGTKRISATISGLINYARPAPVIAAKVQLDRLVEDTFAFVAHQPLFRAIRLEKSIAPGLPAISADPNQLSQILMNLLLNAAQAMPDGGNIMVTVEKAKLAGSVEIRVSDTGCGIPADIVPHVFEPFFTTKRGKGTGLGLSISQAYVRSHGGDIRVESLPGRGTTVSVILPIRQASTPAQEMEEVVV